MSSRWRRRICALHDRRQVERLAEQVEDGKVMGKLKEEITLKSTKITSDKFRELK